MVESKIYIGLNDPVANTQLFENEKYIRVLRNVSFIQGALLLQHTGGRIYL